MKYFIKTALPLIFLLNFFIKPSYAMQEMGYYQASDRASDAENAQSYYEKGAAQRELLNTGFVGLRQLGDKEKKSGYYIEKLSDKISTSFYITPGGFSFEGNYKLTQKLQFSIGYDRFNFALNAFEIPVSGIGYNVAMDAPGMFAILKYKRNLLSNFYYAAGLYFGDVKLTGNASLTGSVDIGDKSYSLSGSNISMVATSQLYVQPFIGLGYERKLISFNGDNGNSEVYLNMLAGVRYSGLGEVSLNIDNASYSRDSAFINELTKEAKDAKASGFYLGLTPVVRIGLGYKF